MYHLGDKKLSQKNLFDMILIRVTQKNWPSVYSDKDPKRNREVVAVTRSSMLAQKNLVERMAGYFQREMNYKYKQFLVTDQDAYRAFLFSLEGYWVGAAVFRNREEEKYNLQWVWLHPFARHRGLLKDVWAKWENHFGKFRIEGPISPGMKEFLGKQGVWMARVINPAEKAKSNAKPKEMGSTGILVEKGL